MKTLFFNFVVLIVFTQHNQSVRCLNLLKTIEHIQHNIQDVSGDLKPLTTLDSAVQEELKDKSRVFINKLLGDQPLQDGKGSCQCSGFTCGCCIHAEVKEIHLDGTVCANFSYLPSPKYVISLDLLFNGKNIFHKEISARNPPSVCFDIPGLKKLASACLKFYNLSVANKAFSGCVKIEVKLKFIVVKALDLGCFKIPPGGAHVDGEYGDSRYIGYRRDNGVDGQANADHVSGDLNPLTPLESDVQEELNDKSRVFINKLFDDQPLNDGKGSCQCSGFTCGCCIHAEVIEIHLDGTVCANFSYLPSPKYGISLDLLFNGKNIFHKEISARNPPSVCFDIPGLKKLAKACLKFYNLSVANKTFSGCVKIEVKLKFIVVKALDLGCFKIPPGGAHVDGEYDASSRYIGYRRDNGVDRQVNADKKLYFKPDKKSIKLINL